MTNHPLSYVSSCGVAPAAFPHNTLNFTRVEHFYKQEYGLPPPCLQAVVYSTNQINHTTGNKDSQITRAITVINAKNIQIIRAQGFI